MYFNKTHIPVTENWCNLNARDFICRHWWNMIFVVILVVILVILILAVIFLYKYCKCKNKEGRQGIPSNDSEANLLKPPHSAGNDSYNGKAAPIGNPILKYKTKIIAAIPKISDHINPKLSNPITIHKKKDYNGHTENFGFNKY